MWTHNLWVAWDDERQRGGSGVSEAATTPTATTARREATRTRLLDAAAEVFAELGLDGASVETICERAGFTRGAFYSNFDSKDALILALTERLALQKLALVSEHLRELIAEGDDLSVREVVARLVGATIDHRDMTLLTSEIRMRAMRDPVLGERYLSWQAALVESVSRVIDDVSDAYGLRLRLPAHEVATLIQQTWEETTVMALIEGLDFDAVYDRVQARTVALATALADPP